jgi:hypothetical protein
MRRRKWRKRRRIKTRKGIRRLYKTRKIFMDTTFIRDFVSKDPYCSDYAGGNYDVKNGYKWGTVLVQRSAFETCY